MPRAGSESPILDRRGPGGWGTTSTRGERAALRGDLTQARDTSATRQARARRALFRLLFRFPTVRTVECGLYGLYPACMRFLNPRC